jgi:hypothetical protein
MHPLTACQGRRCTEQRGRKTWMVGEGGCNPVRKSRALCEANRFFHNAQCVAMPRSRPAMVDFGYDPPSVASGGDAPQAMRMQQVMHDRVQQADRPHRSDPMNQHPPEPTVLHLGICVLGQLAPPIHLLAPSLAMRDRQSCTACGSCLSCERRFRSPSGVIGPRCLAGGL